MEKFIWKKSGRKNIPGSVPVEDTEFLYFEDDGKNTFSKQLHNLVNNVVVGNAQYGGMGEAHCKIWLPNGRLFHAIDYNGDLEGWRKDIEIGTKVNNVELAKIEGDKIVLHNGESFLLQDCKIEDKFKIPE